jgi:hypothetical protein
MSTHVKAKQIAVGDGTVDKRQTNFGSYTSKYYIPHYPKYICRENASQKTKMNIRKTKRNYESR